MRGTTAKRLRVYANFLITSDPQYKDMKYKTVCRRLKKLWTTNAEFKSYIQLKVTADNGQVFIDNNV